MKLATFSRVSKEKGIEDAVSVIRSVNEKLGYSAYSLDIYGSVAERDRAWFESLRMRFPDCVRYKGVVSSSRSVDVLKDYFALLFPTYYPGEGFAGTLIDAYSAGLPVIASDWRYNKEFVNGHVGAIYPSRDNAALESILLEVANDPMRLLGLKRNCLKEAGRYTAEEAMKALLIGLAE